MNAVMNTITPARTRHAWPWVLGGLLLLCLLATGSMLAWLMNMGSGFHDGPLVVTRSSWVISRPQMIQDHGS